MKVFVFSIVSDPAFVIQAPADDEKASPARLAELAAFLNAAFKKHNVQAGKMTSFDSEVEGSLMNALSQPPPEKFVWTPEKVAKFLAKAKNHKKFDFDDDAGFIFYPSVDVTVLEMI